MARTVPDAALRNNGRDVGAAIPPPFSKPFMEVIGLAVDEGRVAARRAGALLDLTVDDLDDLFATHGVQSPVEL